MNLLMEDVAGLALGSKGWADPIGLFRTLEARTRIRALQSGEPGPFHRVIAALDIAAWDLIARRAGRPLFRLLADEASDVSTPVSVGAYASGIHIDDAPDILPRARATGFSAFKVKVGFDAASEPDKVRAAAKWLAEGERLFADANQAWDVAGAEAFLARSAGVDLGWIEEPIPVDSPHADSRSM